MCRDNRFFPFFVLSIYQTAREEGQACASLKVCGIDHLQRQNVFHRRGRASPKNEIEYHCMYRSTPFYICFKGASSRLKRRQLTLYPLIRTYYRKPWGQVFARESVTGPHYLFKHIHTYIYIFCLSIHSSGCNGKTSNRSSSYSPSTPPSNGMTLHQSGRLYPHTTWGSPHAFKLKPLLMSTDELCRLDLKLYNR